MSVAIKSLPTYERPRERLVKLGAYSLSLQELLIIILGQGSTKVAINQLCEEILAKHNNLRDISSASIFELCKIKGIGQAKAIQIKAALELGKRFYLENSQESNHFVLTSTQAFEIAKYFLKDKNKEYLMLFCLDSRGRLITEPQVISIGTLNASLVHPREVFGSAISQNAAKVMLAHNHPSGSEQPSEEDLNVTRQLFQAGVIMGIELIDHIIVGNPSFTSIREIKPDIFKLSKYHTV